MEQFSLNRRVTIEGLEKQAEAEGRGVRYEAVERAIARFYRDMEMTLDEPLEKLSDESLEKPLDEPLEEPLKKPGKGVDRTARKIYLEYCDMDAEQYKIRIEDEATIVIQAGDELGFVYALLFISERFLGIHPFWFWNDQTFTTRKEVLISTGIHESVKKPVAYRGWFINDEVLLSHWDAGREAAYPWEMAFEALLRCGGNVVIPGTDRNSKLYAGLASSMGLWITHHHAEPLGAEMFLRAYPDKNPSFRENPDLFRRLWEEGIIRQKEEKVIWNLGFRGQGDTPFWENDPLYDTPEKRGSLIRSIMEEQYALVKKYIPDPVCCTNLYGETMELYQQGYLTLPEGIIMIWADNGYGKMVSRRQGNHNPRIVALPEEALRGQSHGVYYHVSFYDLQAANVLTMIPNRMEFVERELGQAYDSGIRELWLVNCSNIKPHVYPLDFIASLWNGNKSGVKGHLERYLDAYYLRDELRDKLRDKLQRGYEENEKEKAGWLRDRMKACFQEYFQSMLPYGEREDEHAGEQFYNYVARILIHGWMKDGGARPCTELGWCAPFEDFSTQISWFGTVCHSGRDRLFRLLEECEKFTEEAGDLWRDSLLLQVKIHAWCVEGALHFVRAYEGWKEGELMEAFYQLGEAADWYEAVDREMKACCHDKWNGFYDNDCQSDIKQTAYLLRLLMGYVRNLGDGPYFYQWQREIIYSEEDRRVILLTNEENHMTDQELYGAMKAGRSVIR